MTATDPKHFTPNRSTGLRLRIANLIQAVGWLLCVATGLTFLARHWWCADLLANLRIQLTIALLVITVALACCRSWKSMLIQLLMICLHLPWLASGLPSSPAGPTNKRTAEPPTEHSLTVTTANVYTGNRRFRDIEAQLRHSNSDVVAVIELSSDLASHLSQAFSERYPYSIIEPQDRGNFGIGLYSKTPFASSSILFFSSQSIPSIAASVVCGGKSVHVLATHTLPPMGAYAFEHRNAHLQKLQQYVQQHRRQVPEVPVVVVGDLNLTPWSPVYHDFLNTTELTSAATGFGWTPTWYRYPSFPFGLVLDHVLMTDGLQAHSYDVSNDAGSDHRFVNAKLTW